MPDGDKFERKLFGLGWRKAYRLSCNGAKESIIADVVIKAIAHGLRNKLACSALSRICDAISQALSDAGQDGRSNFQGGNSVSPFYMLSVELERIQSTEPASLSIQLAVNAAQSAYLKLEESSQSISRQELQSHFSQCFVEGLIRNQWLDRVRDGIAESQRRSANDQMAWEQKLIATLAEPANKLMESAFKASSKEKIRAPRRLTPQMRMTLDELNQGLTVLEM
jgi:hypothetical protein